MSTAAHSNLNIADIVAQATAGFEDCLSSQARMPVGATVIVAVSGGSDSIALLQLTQRYLQNKRSDCRLIAVTIDHKLRPESAIEAAGVGVFCQSLGVTHQILSWEGIKPATGVASAARDARYDLLVQAAKQNVAAVILTGHSADDQVETYLMRAQRLAHPKGIVGEGRGLAAMATQTLLQNSVLLCRPLLKLWREDLRKFLRSETINWFDDPSNINLAYERPRVRLLAQNIDKQAVFAAAEQATLQRRSDNSRIGQLLRNTDNQIRLSAGDRLLLPQQWNAAFPDETPLALGFLLAAIGGKPFLPTLHDCAGLADWLDVPAEQKKQRRTLHHCVIEKSAEGVSLWRENRNLPRIELPAGESELWDGRYCITNICAEPITIMSLAASLGMALNAQQLSGYIGVFNEGTEKLQRDALLSSPVILCDGVLKEIPALLNIAPQNSVAGAHLPSSKPVAGLKRYFSCFDRVLAGHDFEVAEAVKTLLTMPLNHKYR